MLLLWWWLSETPSSVPLSRSSQTEMGSEAVYLPWVRIRQGVMLHMESTFYRTWCMDDITAGENNEQGPYR